MSDTAPVVPASDAPAPTLINVVNITDGIKAALEAGDIVTETATVKVNKVDVPYTKYVALTVAGALAFCSGRMEPEYEKDDKGEPKVDPETGKRVEKRGSLSVLGEFNYGADLGVRATVRQRYLATQEGPEKAIEKAVKALTALGMDEATARSVAEAQAAKMAATAPAETPADAPTA